jgi:hypothetical protein
MASPIAAAYSQVERNRTPYLGHPAPSLTFPGFAIQAHPDFNRYWPMWRTIRDCFEGEATIKAAGQVYLRKLSAHKDKEYEAFLSRAYFYNATRRTHEGLMGSLFRKPPEFTMPPRAQSIPLDDVTIDGQTAHEFVKAMAAEVTLMGRYGVLVDLPNVDGDLQPDTDRPYLSGYVAECIYSWREVMHRGRRILDRVVLREDETTLTDYGVAIAPVVRVLRLDPDPEYPDQLVYSQEIIRPSADPDQPPHIISVPVTVRGRTLNYIPFVFVNTKSLLPAVSSPPLMDIATINISHYQSTALLEHGRFYAGMPTYVVSAGSDSSPDVGSADALAVGPSNVWELEKDAKAWILEFNGHGLTFLENAVDSKQLQMQSLGGKLISSQRKAAALSSEAYALMETGDEATLLDVAQQVERAMAKALTYLADFRAIELDPRPTVNQETGAVINNLIVVEMNKEFVRTDLTARELRAIQSLYTTGLIPLDVLYYALRSVNVIPIEYTIEDFRSMMADKSQLYPDATGKQQRDDALRNRVEVARISAHVDEPAKATPTPPGNSGSPQPQGTGNNPFGGNPANQGS